MKATRKRGGVERVDLDPEHFAAPDRPDDLLALDEAREQLEQDEPQVASLVKLRYFAGFTVPEAAEALGVSPRTADAWWAFAVTGADGRPLVADFHALWHSCGVLAEVGGATLREVMTLMRHSDPKLTMRIYGRLRVHDLAETVRAMPLVLPAPAAGLDPLAPDLAPVLAPPPDGSSGRLMVREGRGAGGYQPEGVIVPGVDGELGPGMAGEVSAPRRTRTVSGFSVRFAGFAFRRRTIRRTFGRFGVANSFTLAQADGRADARRTGRPGSSIGAGKPK
jgi:hypothetical protein